MLTDEELLKYSPQIMLSQIDIVGQEKLAKAHVVVLGLGGLGSPVCMYLASAGIGELTLIDDDRVELPNLQRQIVHGHPSLGKFKVDSACKRIEILNPECTANLIKQRLDDELLRVVVDKADVVVDCSDNFKTRFQLNRVCYQQRTPLVSGAAIRWEGQLTTFKMDGLSPCYRCLYDETNLADQTCSDNGVVAPLVGIIGSMQALEVIKLITNAGKPAIGQLMLWDGLDLSFSKISFKKKRDCPVCGSKPTNCAETADGLV